jgi:hypothetical protein
VVADEGVVFVKFSNLTSCPSALLRVILARPLGTNAFEATFNRVLGKEAVDCVGGGEDTGLILGCIGYQLYGGI